MAAKRDLEQTPPVAEITGLSHDGRGVGRHGEHALFVDNALPGETVRYRVTGKRRKTYSATVESFVHTSANRISPDCRYFGTCGGCALQHLDYEAQILWKHRQLVEALARIGHVEAQEYLQPQPSDQWRYRRKARLGVRDVPKKGGILVGFRERHKSYVTSLADCLVLDSQLAALLTPLHALVSSLSCRNQLPQIEVAAADNAHAIVIRHLTPLNDRDLDELKRFSEAHQVRILLQPQGLDSIQPLQDSDDSLYYEIEGLQITFGPADFIQVNAGGNRVLVRTALDFLAPRKGEHILDLFSGVGNFSLPIAAGGARVTGLEGDPRLVTRAAENARRNGISNTEFFSVDLYREDLQGDWLKRRYDKLLLDPPRSGAVEVVKRIPALRPQCVVYVSCNPATLARDAGILVNQQGFILEQAGIIDMFPHTAHVESIACFRMP